MKAPGGHVEKRPRPRRHGTARARVLRAVVGACLTFGCVAPLAATETPDWDQAENIKDAAVRLAQMQRTQGATRAFAFIDACYKTHSLSSSYTKAFEACIAQDYLETQILALIYSRLTPETLKRMGAPSPELLAQSMGKRVTQAFASYNMPVARVEAFKKLVDEHGFPVFFEALFPDAKMPFPDNATPPKQK